MSLFRYRAGQREPGIMTVEALAHALGMRISIVPAARN
jgi:DNA-binding phage protein